MFPSARSLQMLVLVNGRELLLRHYAPAVCAWSCIMVILLLTFASLVLRTSALEQESRPRFGCGGSAVVL